MTRTGHPMPFRSAESSTLNLNTVFAHNSNTILLASLHPRSCPTRHPAASVCTSCYPASPLPCPFWAVTRMGRRGRSQ